MRRVARLLGVFHHQIGAVVAGAVYRTRPFLTAVRPTGWEAVARMRNTRLSIAQDAMGPLPQATPVVWRTGRRQAPILWHFPAPE